MKELINTVIHINTTIKTKIIVVNLKTHRIDNNMLKAILKNTRNDTIMVEIIEENKFLKKKTRNPAVQKNGYISLLPFS